MLITLNVKGHVSHRVLPPFEAFGCFAIACLPSRRFGGASGPGDKSNVRFNNAYFVRFVREPGWFHSPSGRKLVGLTAL